MYDYLSINQYNILKEKNIILFKYTTIKKENNYTIIFKRKDINNKSLIQHDFTGYSNEEILNTDFEYLLNDLFNFPDNIKEIKINQEKINIKLSHLKTFEIPIDENLVEHKQEISIDCNSIKKSIKKLNNKIYTYHRLKRLKEIKTNEQYKIEDKDYFSYKENVLWFYGIVVFLENAEFLKDIQILIGGAIVFTIDIQLLIKLFSYKINNTHIFIPFPKKFIINKSFNQDELNYPFKNKHLCGIPLFALCFHEIHYIITSTKPIICDIIIEFTIANFLNPFKNNNIRCAMFHNVLSYQKIQNNNIKELRKKNNCNDEFTVNIIQISEFINIISNYKPENYKKIIIYETTLKHIIESNILLNSLCKLVLEYCEYDYNTEIIIYDNTNYYRIHHDVLIYYSWMAGLKLIGSHISENEQVFAEMN